MPVIFVFCGVILILLLCKVFVFENVFYSKLCALFLLLFVLSYFASNISIFDVYFNWMQMCLWLTIFVLLLFKTKLNLKIILFSLFVVSVYYVYLKFCFSANSLYSYQNLAIVLLGVSSGILSFDFCKNIITALLSLTGIIVLNCIYEIDCFTFSIIDFDFMFQIIFIAMIVCYFRNMFILKFNFCKVGCYEKTNVFDVAYNYGICNYKF